MSTVAPPPPPQVRWNLNDLFSGIDDPRIDETWAKAKQAAQAFAQTYRGKIEATDLDPQTLFDALTEIEKLSVSLAKPLSFANLMFACDAATPAIGAFLQSQREKATEISVALTFFELELQAAPQTSIDRCLADPRLENYRHYVQTARVFSPYRLSEPEEVLLEETSNTGARAWRRLFDQLTANHEYRFAEPGKEERKVSEQEILTALRHPDRGIRLAAAESFSAGLKEMEGTLVFIYNNLIQDQNVEDRLRGLEYPELSRHLSNELDKATVDLVMRLCREEGPLVARYYRVKRKILGLDELTHIDRYAPLFDADSPVEFDEARVMVLDAFAQFSDTLKSRAAEFFDKQWIDAEPRQGKTGGAFCSYVTPELHPFVFMSYLNQMDNVMTLAHELGHGVHASLSREQTYFNFHGTLPLAELASTFGEMLVFEKLVATANLKDKLALYAEKIEGAFATVFRQAAMFRFEQRCHEHRRATGELSADDFGDIWQDELQSMFGDSVKLGEQHRSWWSYVSHFIEVPFYVYAYSFGELLALAIFQMSKEAPDRALFASRYEEVLKLGGSKTPFELMSMLGVDLRSEAFWQGGFRVIESLVAEFERLWTEHENTK